MEYATPILPDFLDQMFNNIGTIALRIVIINSILLSIVSFVIVSTASEEYVNQFVSRAGGLFSINWFIKGFSDIVDSTNKIVEGLKGGDPLKSFGGFTNFVFGAIKIFTGVIVNILGGYITLAIFIASISPPILKPVGFVISSGLFFVQFCAYWVFYKYLAQAVMYIVKTVGGLIEKILEGLRDFFKWI